ncbi:MAG: hypothetical protein Q9191_004704 [Dirinaria sp. TL-2023a]
MSAPTYTSIHLAKRPTDQIVPGETFTLKTNKRLESSDLKDGEVLFQSLYLSLDPAMRGWLNDTKSYVPPVQIGQVMRGVAIGVVKASKSGVFPVGSYATGSVGWTEYSIINEKHIQKADVPVNGRITDVLGVLGMTGLTAYFGLLDVGKVGPGDFVVVSGAAGATGSVVGQIAKLKGATVLGIAGTDDKVQWLKDDLGFDNALNYKAPEFPKKFKEATKDQIDVFFDNAVSQYNSSKPEGPKNFLSVISKRIRMQGFIVFDYVKQYSQARKELSQWLSEGKIQRKETIVKGGLAKAEKALVDLYNGINTGKLLVEVSPDDSVAKASL